MKTLPCFPTDEDIEKYRKDPASFVKDVFRYRIASLPRRTYKEYNEGESK